MTQPLVDYYALLGVARTASATEIEQAIRQGIRTWSKQTARPELDKRQAAERKMQQLKEAREILLDGARRRGYDQQLAAASLSPPGPGSASTSQPGEWLELAQQAMAVADYRTAVQAAEQARATDERSPTVWGILARANAGLGRFDEAVFQARRAIHLAPDTIDHYYLLAESYEQAGDWSNALRAYESLAQRDPTSDIPHMGIASVHLSMGDPNRAVALLEHLYQHGRERQLAGDYLAMALTRTAELVPAVQVDDGYVITWPQEIAQMRQLLDRARSVTQDLETLTEVARTRQYVEHMAGRAFVWQRLFGRWARRFALVAVLVLGCSCLGSGLSDSSAPVGLAVFGTVACLAGLVLYAFVPRWRFNRAEYYGEPVTY